VPGEKLNPQLHQIAEVRDVTQSSTRDFDADAAEDSWGTAWEEDGGAGGVMDGGVAAGGGVTTGRKKYQYHPELEDGVVLEVVRPGMRDGENAVLR
jgi:hypothetical protein